MQLIGASTLCIPCAYTLEGILNEPINLIAKNDSEPFANDRPCLLLGLISCRRFQTFYQTYCGQVLSRWVYRGRLRP